jgi:diguanylate cyclase (GGDEF)-like protein
MGTAKVARKRTKLSLQLLLSGLCGAAGLVLAALSALALYDATSLRNDLDSFDREAHQLLHTERVAAASWRHFAREVTGLGSASDERSTDRSLAHVLDEARPWLSRDSWSSFDELLEATARSGQRALAVAERSDQESARTALTEELNSLALARVARPVADARGRGSRRLQDLAARAGRINDHPVMSAAGASKLASVALPAYYESLVAARLIESLRMQEWYSAAGAANQDEIGKNFSVELDRLLPGDEFDARRRAIDMAPGGPERETYIAEVEGVILERWPQGAKVFSDLVIAANALITFIGIIGLLGTFACAGISLLVSRTLFSPLEYLSTRLRLARADAHTPALQGGEIGTRWKELQDLENAFVETTSELEASHRERHNLAFYDGVTGLANRRFFTERLETALVSARVKNWPVALISVGIEGIREAGDTFGEATSQAVLRETSERLCEVVRLTDFVGSNRQSGNSPASVSRSGEADFSLLLSNVDSAENASRVAERAVAALQVPYQVEGRELSVEFQLGIAIFPDDARTGADLIRASRTALEHSRNRGNATPYQFFSNDMNDSAARNFHLRSRLSGALERGDLRLHFQPFRSTTTGKVSGAEVLLRWTDAEMGPVPPQEFIELAERGGLIHSIGRWVLEGALVQQQEWIARGYEPVRMAVNVSAVQLGDPTWSASVMDALEKTGGDPTQLELEITETAILLDSSAGLEAFEELDALGVGIVLDDFGTGYSQLSYLHRYPIQRIKIDRSFIASIGDTKAGAAVTQAILTLAHSLGLQVIAEGIETEEQANFLTENGCEEIQGYLISHALPPEEFERFLVKAKNEDDDPASGSDGE